MLVDMHVHTVTSSPCSFIHPEELIEWAQEVGLDAVCVTEHDEVEGAMVAYELGKRKGFPVFRGVEIYTDLGDMLVFGLLRDAPSWIVPFEELWQEVQEAGGAIIPAHPCRNQGNLFELLGKDKAETLLKRSDALEVLNGGTNREYNKLAMEIARSYGLPGVGGSDAHHLAQVGRCLTVFQKKIKDERELIEEIRSGRCQARYMDEVPSLRQPQGGEKK